MFSLGRMRGAVVYGKHDLRVEDVYRPRLGPRDVLIQVKACGVCGTDIHIYEGMVPMAKMPITPGHEFSGVVTELGGDVAWLREGEHVVVDPNLACGTCYYCRTGRRNLCLSWGAIGITVDGAYADYVKAPAEAVYKMPPNISFEEGAFAEPIGCCIEGVRRAQISLGDVVMILGAGPIGLIHLQLAKHAGAGFTIVSEISDRRRALAEELGADLTINPMEEDLTERVKEETGGRGVDVAIEAVGSPQTVNQAIRMVGPGGRVLIFGVCPEEAEIRLKPFQVYRKEISIIGSFINPYTTEPALTLLSSRVIKVKPLISHEISLGEAEKALKRELKDAVKVLIKPSG